MSSYEEIKERASLPLQRKMDASIALMRKAEKLALRYDADNGFFLAFSGGKDSQALYHMAELAGVKFKAHFSPTTCDPPQVIRFIHEHYPDCEFHHPKISIYDKAVQMTILPSMRVRWCCSEYKENAGASKVTLIGIRHAESVRRSKRKEIEISSRKFSGSMDEFETYQVETIKKKYKNLNIDEFSIKDDTSFKCINGKDSILVSPIIEWTEKDVWEFLNDVVQVPHCCLYDAPYNQHRIGCILCPMSSHKQKMKDIELYPHVKRQWIKAIKAIRAGGGVSQSKLMRQNYGLWGGGDYRQSTMADTRTGEARFPNPEAMDATHIKLGTGGTPSKHPNGGWIADPNPDDGRGF